MGAKINQLWIIYYINVYNNDKYIICLIIFKTNVFSCAQVKICRKCPLKQFSVGSISIQFIFT